MVINVNNEKDGPIHVKSNEIRLRIRTEEDPPSRLIPIKGQNLPTSKTIANPKQAEHRIISLVQNPRSIDIKYHH